MEEYFQSDSEGYVVKDFDKVDNWYVWEGDQWILKITPVCSKPTKNLNTEWRV